MFFWPMAAMAPSAIDSTEITTTDLPPLMQKIGERHQHGAHE